MSFLLFLASFVDRSNLVNARIEGLETLVCFTIPYILFEVTANMLLKKIKPHWWLSGLMHSWGNHSMPVSNQGLTMDLGICTMRQGFTQNPSDLTTCRALMGFFGLGSCLAGILRRRRILRYWLLFRSCVPDRLVLQMTRISISIFHFLQRGDISGSLQWSMNCSHRSFYQKLRSV